MPGDLLNTAFDPDPDPSYLQAAGGGGGIDWAKAAQLLGKSIGGGAGGGTPAGSGRMMPPAQMPLTSLNRPLPQPPASADSQDQQALIAQLSDAIRRAEAANALSNQQQR